MKTEELSGNKSKEKAKKLKIPPAFVADEWVCDHGRKKSQLLSTSLNSALNTANRKSIANKKKPFLTGIINCRVSASINNTRLNWADGEALHSNRKLRNNTRLTDRSLNKIEECKLASENAKNRSINESKNLNNSNRASKAKAFKTHKSPIASIKNSKANSFNKLKLNLTKLGAKSSLIKKKKPANSIEKHRLLDKSDEEYYTIDSNFSHW